jgi:hypothetical protein
MRRITEEVLKGVVRCLFVGHVKTRLKKALRLVLLFGVGGAREAVLTTRVRGYRALGTPVMACPRVNPIRSNPTMVKRAVRQAVDTGGQLSAANPCC